MCPNGQKWCKGPGGFGSKCLKCQSVAVTHEVVAAKQPAAIKTALQPRPVPAKKPVIVPQPVAKPVPRIANLPAKKPVVGKTVNRTFFQTAATHKLTEQQKQKQRDLQNLFKKDKLTAPRTQGGPIWRGENGASGGKSGRDPSDVYKAGGLKPWQITSLPLARSSLENLCAAATDTLYTRATDWQKSKNRSSGYFISTGTDPKSAYDGYQYFYRITIPTLYRRDWDSVGVKVLDDNVHDCFLYTDQPTVAGSNWIAILCLKEKSRAYELLVMNPIPTSAISVRTKGTTKFVKLKDWTAEAPTPVTL